MPYFITDSSPDCDGFATIKEDGEVIGCHATKQAAIDQMVAVSIAEDMEPGGERDLRISPNLPDAYRPASSPDVPANHNCGNCGFFYNYYCKRWDALVSPHYYCAAWAPVSVRNPNDNPGSTVESGDISGYDLDYYGGGTNILRQLSFDVPQYIRRNARKGLDYYGQGLGGDGLVDRTIREAREMASGTISEDKAVRMAAWIARHLVDFDAPQNSDPQDPGYPGPGLVAHLLWGSGPNRAGAERAMRWAEAQRPAEKARVPGLVRMRAEDIRGMTDALAKVIAGLSAETARKVERNWAHIQQRPDDTSAYWSDEKAERLLLAAMEPYVKTVATQTVGAIEQRFAAKAGMLDIIIPRLLRSVGIQIKTVPRTLLKTVRSTIDEGLRDGLSARDLGKLIEDRVGNNEYFAERIARTEAMRLQNAAAIEGYREAGITEVILRDGDEDEVCRARDGRRVPITEAQAEILAEHPNGTLYFEPVTEFTAAFANPEQVEQPMTQKAATVAMPAITLSPTFQFTMPENPAPVVNVEAPVVNLPAPIVNIAAPEAPTVNVTTPEVVVNVPEAKAGLVQDIRIVEMPARSLSQVVVRDPAGKIVGVESASE